MAVKSFKTLPLVLKFDTFFQTILFSGLDFTHSRVPLSVLDLCGLVDDGIDGRRPGDVVDGLDVDLGAAVKNVEQLFIFVYKKSWWA